MEIRVGRLIAEEDHYGGLNVGPGATVYLLKTVTGGAAQEVPIHGTVAISRCWWYMARAEYSAAPSSYSVFVTNGTTPAGLWTDSVNGSLDDVGTAVAWRSYGLNAVVSGKVWMGLNATDMQGIPSDRIIARRVTPSQVDGTSMVLSSGTWVPAGTFDWVCMLRGKRMRDGGGSVWATDCADEVALSITVGGVSYEIGSNNTLILGANEISSSNVSLLIEANSSVSGVLSYVWTATGRTKEPSGDTLGEHTPWSPVWEFNFIWVYGWYFVVILVESAIVVVLTAGLKKIGLLIGLIVVGATLVSWWVCWLACPSLLSNSIRALNSITTYESVTEALRRALGG